ncbi:uncharacterized protein LOC133110553 isoform X2 [Conger conger]|uniref:uncharacterized protein LOC133110553 isoform X2 n=1 Tax=Conger conger TaxID=82655 RepID=UPI002A5A1BB6|nr:uncharacterized protein LOC133110553 isoform X2 [Conger conger]
MDKEVFSDMAASRNGDGSSLLDLDTGFLYSGSSIDLHQRLQVVRMSRSATAVEYPGLRSSALAPRCHPASARSPSLSPQVRSPLTWDHTPEPNGGLVVPVEVQSHPEIVVEYTGVGTSSLASRCHSASVLSTSLALKVQSPPLTPLTVPAEVLSSTPREGEKLKPELDSLPNLSLIDLLSPRWSPLSWKVSPSHSPPCSHTVSLLDSTPECRSPSFSLVEVSFV